MVLYEENSSYTYDAVWFPRRGKAGHDTTKWSWPRYVTCYGCLLLPFYLETTRHSCHCDVILEAYSTLDQRERRHTLDDTTDTLPVLSPRVHSHCSFNHTNPWSPALWIFPDCNLSFCRQPLRPHRYWPVSVLTLSHTSFSFFLWSSLSEGCMGAERAPCLYWTPTMVSPPHSPLPPLHVTAWYVQLTSRPAWTLSSNPFCLINKQNVVEVCRTDTVGQLDVVCSW